MSKEREENIIELRHLTKTYEDGFTAVSDFNLQIKRGEFVTFLGPSGCGKTTTLRMIAGFDTPTGGEILLNGKNITDLPPNKRPVNTVFQRYALFPHMNIFENIAFGLKQKKLPQEVIVRKVKKCWIWWIWKDLKTVLFPLFQEGSSRESLLPVHW